MDIKVNAAQAAAPVTQTQNVQPTDGTFKFILASNITEADLQAHLSNLMEEITRQGDALAKKRDIRDMRKYRALIKEFLNEIINRSHSFARENFLDSGSVSSLPSAMSFSVSSQSQPSTPPVLKVRFLPYMSGSGRVCALS